MIKVLIYQNDNGDNIEEVFLFNILIYRKAVKANKPF